MENCCRQMTVKIISIMKWKAQRQAELYLQVITEVHKTMIQSQISSFESQICFFGATVLFENLWLNGEECLMEKVRRRVHDYFNADYTHIDY